MSSPGVCKKVGWGQCEIILDGKYHYVWCGKEQGTVCDFGF